MTFKDKRTNELVKANSYAEKFAFSHNSNYEIVTESKEEKPKANSKKKTESKEEKPKANSKKKTESKEDIIEIIE